jgi:hypothetical protein
MRDGVGHVPVEVVKEGQQVEGKLNEAFLLVARKCSEDLSCVVHMIVVHDPINGNKMRSAKRCSDSVTVVTHLLALKATKGKLRRKAVH